MSKRILLIDDERDIRKVASISLECLANWKLLDAASGEEGIATAEAEQPDVILLDAIMPRMDGPATFAKLRANPATRDIPVIFLTAKVPPADQHHFRELGLQGWIAKPFDPMLLAAQIAQTLGW